MYFTSGAIISVMLGIAIKRHHFWNATVGVFGLNLAWISVAVLFFGPLLMPEQIPVMLPQQVTPLLLIDNYALFYFGIKTWLNADNLPPPPESPADGEHDHGHH